MSALMEREYLTVLNIKPDTGLLLEQNRTVLTSRSQTVNVGQQLGLGNSWVSHQADVYVALREKSQKGKSFAVFTGFHEGKRFTFEKRTTHTVRRNW